MYFDSSSLKVISAIYFLSLILSQFSVNISVTKELCGESSYGFAFIYTLIPWVFIFGILNVVLIMFPGWKTPFANTFGYLLVKAAGVKSLLLNEMLKEKFDKSVNLKGVNSSNISSDINVSIDHIYSDPSMLINQVTPETFNTFWTRMKPLFRKGASDNISLKKRFEKFVVLKDIVADFIWYLLTGLLVCSMTYNSMVNQNCQRSVKEMQKRHKTYEDNVKKQKEDDAKKGKPRVYYTKD